MTTDIVAEMGYLFLGTRLKRVAERIQADAARILKAQGFAFAPGQFTLMAAIDRHGELAIGDAVAALGLSQPAVTRCAADLIAMGLIEAVSGEDRRRKLLQLTPKGKTDFVQARAAIWPRLGDAVGALCAPLSGPLIDQLGQLEAAMAEASLAERFAQARSVPLEIVEFSDALAHDFHDINAEWIESMFVMEDADRETLLAPREKIVDPGGVILFVRAGQKGIVGTCALRNAGDGAFELTKMGVRETARGLKAGEFLLDAVIARAKTLPIETLYLLTNTKCAAAIHLYEKAGFLHDPEIMEKYGARYERSNVAMRYPL